MVIGFVAGFFCNMGLVLITSPAPLWAQDTEVRVTVTACNCVAKLFPDGATAGNGSLASPYEESDANFDMILGFNGIGRVELFDDNWNVIWGVDQTVNTYTEYRIPAHLLDGYKNYLFMARVNGVVAYWPGLNDIYVEYKEPVVPPSGGGSGPIITLPTVPNTGYMIVFGRAISVSGAIYAGLMGVLIAVIIVLLHKRRHDKAANGRSSLRGEQRRSKPAQR
ncbi:hypothetical protein FACS189431_1190 [Alphaproteobacteria bacterium]|nr:hypothetical protein FACS189431_1190 [Alphaproteobacteria bacterium]